MGKDSNFEKCRNIGRIGENYFEDVEAPALFNNECRVLRVSDEKRFKPLGVDFIFFEKECSIDDVFESIMDNREWKPYFYLAEVKTDEKILESRNMIYEYASSSDKLGWSETTLAHEIFYYGIDSEQNIVAGWRINPQKLKEWFHYVMMFLHGKEKSERIRSNRPASNGRLIFCVNIDMLVKDNIAKEITIKQGYKGFNAIQRFISANK